MVAPKDGRLTKLQRTRKTWDAIVAAHYHYRKERNQGIRVVARLFQMPKSTVAYIVKHNPKDDPEVKWAAARFGLVRLDLGQGQPDLDLPPKPRLDLGRKAGST